MSQFLFPFKLDQTHPSIPIKCNIDLSLYKHSIFLINSEEVSSNVFGLSQGDSYLIATSSQSLSGSLSPIFGTFLIKGQKPQKTPTICLIKNHRRKLPLFLSYRKRPWSAYLQPHPKGCSSIKLSYGS